MNRFKTYKFFQTYKYANNIEESLQESFIFSELDWSDQVLIQTLNSFSKDSILHYYIIRDITLYHDFIFKEEDDGYTLRDTIQYKQTFQKYGITIQNDKDFNFGEDVNDLDDEIEIYPWYCFQEEAFNKLYEKLTDEVFFILFQNKKFLFRFNKKLSNYLKQEKILIQPIQRKNIPKWVKTAVFYRDHGRCAYCLSTLYSIDGVNIKPHYDHIIPLNKFGINDPCNIQLACPQCNQKKGVKLNSDVKHISFW